MFTSLNITLARALYGFAAQNISTMTLAVMCSDGVMVVAASAYVLVMLPLRRSGKYARTVFHDFLPAVAAGFVADVVKFFVPSPRPYVALGFEPIVHTTGAMMSFPSWHVAVLAAFATTLLFYHRKLAYFIAALVPVVMLGRMLVGVHWFSDTLAGLALGALVAAGWGLVERRLRKKA